MTCNSHHVNNKKRYPYILDNKFGSGLVIRPEQIRFTKKKFLDRNNH
jgi:hypothetical protein